MIKQLFRFALHLIILILCVGGSAALFLQWIGYFENDTFVAYLYEDTTFSLIEVTHMTELFDANDAELKISPIYNDVTDHASKMIEKGANTIILNLADTPSDALIALAAENDVTLFFVGALPTSEQLASYDKLWCFTPSPAYAGELLGEQVAYAFRDGTITDKNDDLLLDYIFINTYDTYMETEPAVETTLLELDHYGVYTTDVYAAAYQSALYLAELSASAAAESAEDDTTAEDMALEGTDETENDADATETEGTEQDTEAESTDNVLEVTVEFSALSNAEVILSIGSANANYLTTQAALLGWGTDTVTFACIVENKTSAQTLANTGLYDAIVYLDTASATQALVTMACNALEQTPVTNGTDYAENDAKTFVVPHALYE